MGGLRGSMVFLLAVCACLTIACESDQPKTPEGSPQTVEEFFEALAFGIHQGGKVFHATVEMRFRENSVEGVWATTEGWIEAGRERARIRWQKGPDNTADLAERTVHIHTPEGVYSANLDSDDDPDFRLPTDSELCLRDAPSALLALVACGFIDYGGPDFELTVRQSTFEGRATVVLVGRYPVSSPVGSEEFPRGGPTPHPVFTSSTYGEYQLHIDAENYRPIASVTFLEADPDRKVFGSESRFSVEFLERPVLPKDWFEPSSIGYVPPDEEERRLLEDPKLETPVYWLGRSFTPGAGLPMLTAFDVNGYSPGRQRGSDEPNIQIGLAYSAPEGFVRLDHYPPGDWEAFKARLGGHFPWTWCARLREFSIPGATVTILAGHESFPYQMGQPSIGTLGSAPAQPSVPPLKTELCPTTPHDRFMAEVRFADATIVINGTLGYGGQEGQPWGVFDTDQALELIARGLRLRQTGE